MTASHQNFKSISSKLVPFVNTVGVYFILFLPSDEPSLFSMLIKCLPILSLMVYVILHGISLQPKYSMSRRILLGLMFSCLGDALLVWPNYFLEGMLSFGVAQLMYISAFDLKPLNLDVGVILYVISALGLTILRRNLTGVFQVGVPIYTFLLTTMTWRTIARLDIKQGCWLRYVTCIGGILWLVSDGLLGFHLFYTPLPYSQLFIMGTYYMGQLGIALSVSEQQPCPSPSPTLVNKPAHLVQ
uniref:lysoplasmalogenase n=2 Tax=Cacopsylla melanoneura TaxID=428564 RepID=A0A8D8XB54_9HEMI